MKHTKAYKMGKQAYAAGKTAVPVLDKNFMDFLAESRGQPVGYSIPMLKAWAKGWHEANLKNK